MESIFKSGFYLQTSFFPLTEYDNHAQIPSENKKELQMLTSTISAKAYVNVISS